MTLNAYEEPIKALYAKMRTRLDERRCFFKLRFDEMMKMPVGWQRRFLQLMKEHNEFFEELDRNGQQT